VSTRTTAVKLVDLQFIRQLDAAGETASAIATQLTQRGVTVPRADVTDPETSAAVFAGRTNGNDSISSGYNLPTWPGAPGAWNADAVAAVLAASEVPGSVTASTVQLTIE
jgi:hypothetical protein